MVRVLHFHLNLTFSYSVFFKDLKLSPRWEKPKIALEGFIAFL